VFQCQHIGTWPAWPLCHQLLLLNVAHPLLHHVLRLPFDHQTVPQLQLLQRLLLLPLCLFLLLLLPLLLQQRRLLLLRMVLRLLLLLQQQLLLVLQLQLGGR
jgi:hypothetical protein